MSRSLSPASADSGLIARVRAGFRHAFALDGPHGPVTDEDRALLRRLAGFIVRRKMVTPVVFFLESARPLGYLGSQAMVFLQPFLTAVFKQKDYDRIARIMERREGVAALLEQIEMAQAEAEPGRADACDQS